MTVKLLTVHHLEFLSLKGGYTGSSEPTLVKMPHCWKSHVTAHMTTQNVATILPDVVVLVIIGLKGPSPTSLNANIFT